MLVVETGFDANDIILGGCAPALQLCVDCRLDGFEL
jgi:hypothetical protein